MLNSSFYLCQNQEETEDDGHSHGQMNSRKLDNNNKLAMIGLSVSFINILMFLISEFNFVFIVYNYSNKKCINHIMLIFIGWLNLCEIIVSLYVFYNSKRIIQYLRDLISALKTYGSNESDVQNNLNPTKKMLKHIGIIYMCFLLIELIPSLLIGISGYMKNENECYNFWTLEWSRIIFIIFRIIIIIIDFGLLVGLFFSFLRKVIIGYKKCCTVTTNLNLNLNNTSIENCEERMIR